MSLGLASAGVSCPLALIFWMWGVACAARKASILWDSPCFGGVAASSLEATDRHVRGQLGFFSHFRQPMRGFAQLISDVRKPVCSVKNAPTALQVATMLVLALSVEATTFLRARAVREFAI